MKEEFTKFNLEDYLTTDELRKEYLNQVLADGDIEEFKRALFYIAKSKGIENVAKKANLNRESFYKMFKENSKPRFESIFKVVNALDIKLVYAQSISLLFLASFFAVFAGVLVFRSICIKQYYRLFDTSLQDSNYYLFDLLF